MSQPQTDTWVNYYKQQIGREPRSLLVDAFALYPAQFPEAPPRQAIDLGCGEGTETLALLKAGWQVLAIDRQPEVLTFLQSRPPQTTKTASPPNGPTSKSSPFPPPICSTAATACPSASRNSSTAFGKL